MTHMTETVMLLIRFLVVNDCLGVLFFNFFVMMVFQGLNPPDSVNPCLNYQTWNHFSLHSEAMFSVEMVHTSLLLCQDLRALICLREDEKSKDRKRQRC